VDRPRDRAVLQRLLEDYTNLGNNEFWNYFWRRVSKEQNHHLHQHLGRGFSHTHERKCFDQGIYEAFERFKEYPERFLDDIRREIDK
jgi:hypothetical protein